MTGEQDGSRPYFVEDNPDCTHEDDDHIEHHNLVGIKHVHQFDLGDPEYPEPIMQALRNLKLAFQKVWENDYEQYLHVPFFNDLMGYPTPVDPFNLSSTYQSLLNLELVYIDEDNNLHLTPSGMYVMGGCIEATRLMPILVQRIMEQISTGAIQISIFRPRRKGK